MIEGTKEYKRRSSAPPAVDEKSVPTSGGGEEGTKNPVAPEAAQRAEGLDRRAWFSALVPAFGDGLVKILRASNNLKDDLGLPR